MKPQLRFRRHELKYYLPEQLYPELLRLIRPYMTLDPHLKQNGAKSYLVRSLYLDTNDLKFYHEKLAGNYYREKFRIRGYNEERSNVFLEIKRKYNNFIVKDRVVVKTDELSSILNQYGGYQLNGNRSKSELDFMNYFMSFIQFLQLRPTVLVAYERQAFASTFDESIRLTLDHNLRCLPGRSTDLFYSGADWFNLNNRCILELKFNHVLPFFFKHLIKRLNLWAVAISKYCLCIGKCKELL